MAQEILEQEPLDHESKIRNDAVYQASAVYVIQLAVIAASSPHGACGMRGFS
jgi:hypothetical protein